MKVAIYSRKSKFTGKGDSIENQIEMCKNYVTTHFGADCEVIVYEDEGFSGGTIDRPQFKLMLQDAKRKRFDSLICYRLDRVSRNIADFSSLIEDLQTYNIGFISIKEQFDTTTPMGRAMMYISGVFAQLERETIAERIRDNMLQLAKTGRWLGGITPIGYESKEVITVDQNGKSRKSFKLSPLPDEINLVKLIFEKFLQLKSLTKVETYLIQNEIKTRNNVYFSRFALRTILNNPVYAIADELVYNYFIANGYEVYADKSSFDGLMGVMAYNKTLQKKNQSNKLRDANEWIIAIGAHEGIIEGIKWVQVQELIQENKSKTFRYVRGRDALLSGLLKCAHCGSYMRPKMGRVDKQGNQLFYYMCEMKEKSKRTKCSCKNAHGPQIDNAVEAYLKQLATSESDIRHKLKDGKLNVSSQNEFLANEIEIIKQKIKENTDQINNLVSTLSISQNTSAGKYIIDQINKLDDETSTLKESLLNLSKQMDLSEMKNNELQLIDDMINSFANTVDTLELEEKRKLLRAFISQVVWDGNNIDIILFGSKPIDK